MDAPLKLELTCDCDMQMCDHTVEKVADLLQEAYDSGYESGWDEALNGLRLAMIEKGVAGASNLKVPAPPTRSKKKPKVVRDIKVNKTKSYMN